MAKAAVSLAPLSELEVSADPKSFKGRSTAVLHDRHIEPVDVDQKPVLPAKVTSYDRHGDIDVTVTDASRVIAFDMAGSIASTVWGLGQGDTLVGRDITTEFPDSEDLPIITQAGHSINAEAVIALRPTLLLTDGSIGPRDVVEQLRDVGITVVFVERESSFEGSAELARQVAAALGVPEAGEVLAEQIGDQISDVVADIQRFIPQSKADRLRMVFVYVRGHSGVYYLFGTDSGAEQLIEALGGVDVAKELGWSGMRPMTDEAMVKAKPDVILTMTEGLKSTGGVTGLVEAKPAIALTPAGKRKRFVDMADADVLTFGPRSAGVIDALARAVYAPGASD